MPPLLVLGHLVPKAIVQAQADKLVDGLATPLRLASFVLRPLVVVVGGYAALLTRLTRTDRKKAFVTRDELALLIESEPETDKPEISADEREMIANVFELSEYKVGELMVPLSEVTALPEDAPITEAALEVADKQHSRMPIYRVARRRRRRHRPRVRLLQAAGKSDGGKTVAALAHPPTYVPETMKASDLLVQLQSEQQHLAIVVDEYGGAVGIVTIEDLLEIIVGDIDDEYDTEPSPIRAEKPGVWRIEARTSVARRQRRARPRAARERRDYETIAGLLIEKLRRIPDVGEAIAVAGQHDRDRRRRPIARSRPCGSPGRRSDRRVTSGVTYLEPAPARDELPARFPSPFEPVPHPVARRAAEELLAELARGLPGVPGLELAGLELPGGGKMFGVLVVADRDGRIGYLRAFSGMLDGRWALPGFVPPLFDAAAREAMWPAGQATLRGYELQLRALDADPAHAAARAELATLRARATTAAEELRARHRARRAGRRAARTRLHAATMSDDERRAALHALDQESRADAAEGRRLEAAEASGELAALAARVRATEAARAELERRRADESRDLMKQVHDTYVITSARGERRPLRALFAPGEPPGGAGDCAGPKLLGEAYRRGLVPLALAEVWWGAPPLTGGRHAGAFYPSCRGKCGVILPHMLDGLALAPAPVFGAGGVAADEPRTVYEDAWLVVVDKPAGLLSVPGRSGALRDSVQTRLRQRYPAAIGPLVVHRLDLDTSGLLLVAKDAATHTALQAQFARREIEKRYLAWLDGVVAAERGLIELALRVDLEDRPRQLHDPVHGKPAHDGVAGARARRPPHQGRADPAHRADPPAPRARGAPARARRADRR